MVFALTTAWTWLANDTVSGMMLDAENGRLTWYEGIGCYCDDGAATQTVAEFLQHGVPAGMGALPEDVLAEMNRSVAAITHTSKTDSGP